MDTEIKKLIARIEKLEAAVFVKKAASGKVSVPAVEDTSGPTGGIKLLIAKGFFSKQKSAAEVLSELEGMDYIGYQRQVIQNALNRFSAKKGQLIASTKAGVRMYAKRK